MYSVSSELYVEVGRKLLESLNGRGYYSGVLEFTHEGMACQLRCSVMAYWSEEECPQGIFRSLKDLVPVWWEFHTTTEEQEILNDFSFEELKTYL